ncbi:chemotaxis protein CheW [Alishewanella longhuensis]|uniref:Chemotaxis protein CheW n=1 Tax=Alishewanella longhuensis TaxID=1091037 RepID=A0ABQ3KWB7_9ALTE|nr:chemotaxis protein CheW [Alishewanella longhuensis]GHG63394.1 chemotaxis protein CheW [Alishewanella longhuensis]
MKQSKRNDVVVMQTEQANEQQYLTFQLGQEMFAVGILHIREIIEYGNLTTVPLMPDFVSGVINLRGSVVPVIDLSIRFSRGQSQLSRRTCIVILEVDSAVSCAADSGSEVSALQEVGIIVDAVSEVLEIAPKDIEPAPTFGTRLRAEFIAGMGKVDGAFVILLNVQKALNVEEMAKLASVVEPLEQSHYG